MSKATNTEIETIEMSKRNYSKRDQNRALATQQFQNIACNLSDAFLIYLVVTNNIKDCPITCKDTQLVLKMLDESQNAVQGETVHHKSDAVVTESIKDPRNILEYHKLV